MKKFYVFSLLTLCIFSFSQSSQSYAQAKGQGVMPAQMEKQATASQMEEEKSNFNQMMGPGMMGLGAYDIMYDPRTMASMLGYILKPAMVNKFENDPVSYQTFLDKTYKNRKELLIKIFDYYESLRKPKTKASDMRKIEQAIVDLRWKIFNEGLK